MKLSELRAGDAVVSISAFFLVLDVRTVVDLDETTIQITWLKSTDLREFTSTDDLDAYINDKHEVILKS